MLDDIKYFTNILVKWEITANQFFLCWLLYWDHRELKGGKRHVPYDESAMANLYRYTDAVRSWQKGEVQDLKDKDLIEQPRDGGIDSMEVTDKFINEVIVTDDQAEEFFKAYPTWVDNFNHPSGPEVNLKKCVPEEVKSTYRSLVKTQKKHQRIMKVLRWGNERDKIRWNIENFVRGQMWDHLEELMEKEDSPHDDDQYGTRIAK